MIGRHVLSDASIAPADEYIQLTAYYGRCIKFHSREERRAVDVSHQ